MEYMDSNFWKKKRRRRLKIRGSENKRLSLITKMTTTTSKLTIMWLMTTMTTTMTTWTTTYTYTKDERKWIRTTVWPGGGRTPIIWA